MNVPHLSVLQDVKEQLITAKEEILGAWIHQNECAAILQRHEIDMDLFYGHYASNVFDYFIGVVSGSVALGECPVMAEFIDYLKNKEIRADELFILCSHLKRSVIGATYRYGINSQKLFESISYLFDMNFSGVLRLYTDTIYEKEQEAIEAGKAKEYFLSNMSHEIRTPLNAILGFVSLLKGESLGERHQKYLDIIAQSGENLLHIINDILDFSKLRSGEFAIDPHPFNVHEQISNTLELFVPAANLKSISIHYTINQTIPHCIFADSFRIQQILGNLLSNAIKFSQPNRTVEVNVNVVDSILSISVRDFGTGIALEDQKRIFNPFYQAQEGTKLGVGGSGLGLSICKQLATQMGGEITLESKIGWGSLFVVSLPIEVPLEELCEPAKRMRGPNSFEGTILVAEDNEANQELVRMVLERYGLSVDIVSNGEEACAAAMNNRYDLILMDEQMPIMNGYDATEKILAYEKGSKLSHTPIVALTANVLKGSRERAFQHGYDAFIGKPIVLHEIEEVFERYLTEKEVPKHTDEKESLETVEIERLKKSLMLESEQIRQLLSLFQTKMKQMLFDLNGAIQSRDYERIAKVAHTIKGSSGNFRYEELSRIAAVIEESARQKCDEFDFHEAYTVLNTEYSVLYSSR
ncbi:MAG TPA: ATP-binding protein [Sulfuricurvum sp.]|nr:ATP-binding protein [Sulfuricurvum sp.]